MAKTIQIRNVPVEVHRVLKTRAALEGVSLSDYVLRELGVAEVPDLEVFRRRVAARAPVAPSESPARVVRAQRGRA